jgi:uncharacterized membrane protein
VETIEHTILVDVPVERLWAISTDIERWPEWTPTVTSIRRVGDAPFGLGSAVVIEQPAQRRPDRKGGR